MQHGNRTIGFVTMVVGCLLAALANAQNLSSMDGGMEHYERTNRIVRDTADVACYYKLQFRKDSAKAYAYTKGQTVLLLSDKGLLFTDYYRLLLDSLNDYCAVSRRNAKAASRSFEEAAAQRCWPFDVLAYADLEHSEVTMQREVLRKYQYTEPYPQIVWQLVDRDTTINHVPCKAATCTFGGRRYTAWYAESIALPYGPYLFNGLPGLIMCLYDDGRNWLFTNNGVEKPTCLRQMYTYGDKDIIRKDKREVLSACQNETEN